jgi:hypothetical protein
MSLTEVFVTPRCVSKGMEILRQMKTIRSIGLDASNVFTPSDFWKKHDAGEFGK